MIEFKDDVAIGSDTQLHIKDLAYGGGRPISNAIIWGNLYRLRRGFPVQRRGSIVVATPQFKALTLYSPTSKTAQVPGTTVTPVSITYPRRTR